MLHYNPPTLKIHKGSLGHPTSGQDREVLHLLKGFCPESERVLVEARPTSCQSNPTLVIVNSDPNHVNKSMGINGLYVWCNGQRDWMWKGKAAWWRKQTRMCINTGHGLILTSAPTPTHTHTNPHSLITHTHLRIFMAWQRHLFLADKTHLRFFIELEMKLEFT